MHAAIDLWANKMKLATLFLSICASAAAATGVLSPNISDDGIAEALQPYITMHELAGAVALVATKDRIISITPVGYADVSTKKPMKSDSIFWIASMSKPIAATAVMILVEEGKVSLDDSVRKYLPDFVPKIMGLAADGIHVVLEPPRHSVTIRSLLSHTGGITFRSSLETPTLDAFPLSVRVASYSLEPLMFEPGSDWSYSNAGINTAARIVEVVSGMKYEEFLQKRLFDPLGMKDTTFWPSHEQLNRLAKSYKANESGNDLEEVSITQLHYPLDDHSHRYPMPAGGLFSTAADIARFCQMLLAGGVYDGKRLLTKVSIEEMSRNQVVDAPQKEIGDSGETSGYGLGWYTSPSGLIEHSGAYSTNMRVDPRRGLVLIWLVQHAGFPGDGARSRDTFENFANKHFGSPSIAELVRH